MTDPSHTYAPDVVRQSECEECCHPRAAHTGKNVHGQGSSCLAVIQVPERYNRHAFSYMCPCRCWQFLKGRDDSQ